MQPKVAKRKRLEKAVIDAARQLAQPIPFSGVNGRSMGKIKEDTEQALVDAIAALENHIERYGEYIE